MKGHWAASSNDSRAHLRNSQTNNFRAIICSDWRQFLLLVLCNICYPYSVGSKSSSSEIKRDKFHFKTTYCYLHLKLFEEQHKRYIYIVDVKLLGPPYSLFQYALKILFYNLFSIYRNNKQHDCKNKLNTNAVLQRRTI